MSHKKEAHLLTDLLDLYNDDFKRTFKKIYNLKYDIKILNLENIWIGLKEFKKLKKITNKKLKKQDITFDIGYRYFRNNKLILKKGVFVPQFDTEQIIDLVLEKKIIKGNALEVGSGSGAIAISLAKETRLNVVSIDINKKAIKLARQNDKKNTVKFVFEDFKNFESDHLFDLIISNPPYIGKKDIYIEHWVKHNQPKKALYAKNNGLDFYRIIFEKSKELLVPGGYVIIEIGWNQGEEIYKMAKKIYNNIEILKDYSGHERFMVMKYE